MKRIGSVAALVAMAACGAAATDARGVAGTYTLQTVKGSPLPFAIEDDSAGRIDVLDDAVTLAAAGSYTQNGHYRVTPGGDTARVLTVSNAGTYVVSGHTITLTSQQAERATGSVSATTLTINGAAGAFVYAR